MIGHRDPVPLDEVQRLIQVTFADPTLLQTALVHRSYLNENPGAGLESNERLEFLGDAVLGFVVGRWLYRQYPALPEGRLTEMRAAIVRRETLAESARSLRLGEALLLGRGEEQAGGRGRENNLARVFEAVVGAIEEDRGLAVAERFVLRQLGGRLRALDVEALLDPKSRLQHLTQARWHVAPQYTLVAAQGPDHERQFTVQVDVAGEVMAQGAGASKQDAERIAAERALAALADRGIVHEPGDGAAGAT